MRHEYTLVLGLGSTGVSCVRYLLKNKVNVQVADTREQPSGLEKFQTEFPNVPVHCGQLTRALLDHAKEIVISPGLSIHEPLIAEQIANNKPVIGDIELFARAVKNPVAGITGANGKTTVTTVLGLMVKEAGLTPQVCGNIGTPVLDALSTTPPDFYVMELSSFQLETTYTLPLLTSVILNISPDHMDRYATLQDYINAKQRIYHNCQFPVVNLDEPTIWQGVEFLNKPITISVKQTADFYVLHENGERYLAHHNNKICNVRELCLQGDHHFQNALAAIAMGYVMKLPFAAMVQVLRNFSGLPHRCQRVRELHGVTWYNDSKATNVGAAETAIRSLGKEIKGKLILLAGGLGKDADFTGLHEPVANFASHVILFGRDAPIIAKALEGAATLVFVDSLAAAIQQAAQLAQPGDAVLLSPACASFDMFNNFEHRGEQFMQLVQQLKE